MVICHLLASRFQESDLANIADLLPLLDSGRKDLADLELEDIIAILAQLGKELVKDDEMRSIEGASFISLWLRKDNLERLCALDYGDLMMLDHFVMIRPGLEMRARPRGITCHWLPNNVPSLAFFSLVMAILSKNASVLKVSEVNRPLLTTILRRLNGISVARNDRMLSGSTIVASVCMISYPSMDLKTNESISRIADIKIVWGSGEAVKGVVSLPQKDTCDTLIFGPKYSFAVIDQKYIERKDIEERLRRLAIDISLFNQTACSSPQAIFLEKGEVTAKALAMMLAKAFGGLPGHIITVNKPDAMCLNIINVRGEYLLSEDKGIVVPKDLSWTILLDPSPGLPEPIQGRCVFIKEVDDLDQVAAWTTRKVQTIATCIEDREKMTQFADKASYMGADRFVEPGEMNDFTLPWDGIRPLSRMVRWTTVRRREDAQR